MSNEENKEVLELIQKLQYELKYYCTGMGKKFNTTELISQAREVLNDNELKEIE